MEHRRCSALFWAARHGCEPTARNLLYLGADVNATIEKVRSYMHGPKADSMPLHPLTTAVFWKARKGCSHHFPSYQLQDTLDTARGSSSTTEEPLEDRGDDWKNGVTHDMFQGCCAN